MTIKKYIIYEFHSISNYPNTYTDIGPPSRFSDRLTNENASGDSSYEKKTSSSPRMRSNPKFHRETFQINV